MKKIATIAALLCVATFAQGTFTDTRDKQKYKTVKIGKQTWFAENLNFNAEGSVCYDNKPENCAKYGKLYNWMAASKACPSGWHLPTEEEWGELTGVAGANADTKLKAKNGWDSYADDGSGEEESGGGSDKHGFSALPGGHSGHEGFKDAGKNGYWWTATRYYMNAGNSLGVWFRSIGQYQGLVTGGAGEGTSSLYSVRCVKD